MVTDVNCPTMLTIRQVADRANVSYNCVSTLCKEGKISHIKIGRKALINYEKFIAFLNQDNSEGKVGEKCG